MLVKNEIECYGYIIIHFHAKNSDMDHYGNFTIVTTYQFNIVLLNDHLKRIKCHVGFSCLH